MTISSATASVSYAGDGVSTAFAVPFKFYATSHVRAVLRGADASETVWGEGSDYGLSGAGDEAGGTLTATAAPASGTTLVIRLAVPETQATDLPTGGAFPADAVEQMADRIVQMLLAHTDALTRAVRLPQTDPASAALPSSIARASKYAAFDASGNIVAQGLPSALTSTVPGIASGDAAGVLTVNAGETAFEVTRAVLAPSGAHALLVTDAAADAVLGVQSTLAGGDADLRLAADTLSQVTLQTEGLADRAFLRYAHGADTLSLRHAGTGAATDVLTVENTAKQINLPVQSAFQAHQSADATNVTGDGTAHDIVFDTETFDQNADYDAGAGVFTAPVAGRYLLAASARLGGLTGASAATMSLVTSNATYVCDRDSPSGTESVGLSVVADMDAADTAKIQVIVSGIGADTADVTGDAGVRQTYFSGALLA